MIKNTTALKMLPALLLAVLLGVADAQAQPAKCCTEFSQHLGALGKLAVAVAQTMPPEQYAFKPDPGSMSFGEIMAHVAKTNYAFCAGLKDAKTPPLPLPTDKDGLVKLLSDSFDYCAAVIPNLSDEQLNAPHDSPDGRLPGREILLALFVHVAHHRGQAEVYLRDKGIKPPQYRF